MVFALREYVCDGRRYRLYAPTDKDRKALSIIQHNSAAHRANGNEVGAYETLAEMFALILTPEGMDPKTKDREAVKKEILGLPFGFLIDVLKDIGKLSEVRGR